MTVPEVSMFVLIKHDHQQVHDPKDMAVFKLSMLKLIITKCYELNSIRELRHVVMSAQLLYVSIVLYIEI